MSGAAGREVSRGTAPSPTIASATDYPALCELRDGDLTIDDDREADGASTEWLNNRGERGSCAISHVRKSDTTAMSARDRALASVREADSPRNLTSWIWTALGGPGQIQRLKCTMVSKFY